MCSAPLRFTVPKLKTKKTKKTQVWIIYINHYSAVIVEAVCELGWLLPKIKQHFIWGKATNSAYLIIVGRCIHNLKLLSATSVGVCLLTSSKSGNQPLFDLARCSPQCRHRQDRHHHRHRHPHRHHQPPRWEALALLRQLDGWDFKCEFSPIHRKKLHSWIVFFVKLSMVGPWQRQEAAASL